MFQYWYGVHKENKKPAEKMIPLKIKTASTPELIIITGTNGVTLQLPMTVASINLLKQLLQA
jgi:hypothetical protein